MGRMLLTSLQSVPKIPYSQLVTTEYLSQSWIPLLLGHILANAFVVWDVPWLIMRWCSKATLGFLFNVACCCRRLFPHPMVRRVWVKMGHRCTFLPDPLARLLNEDLIQRLLNQDQPLLLCVLWVRFEIHPEQFDSFQPLLHSDCSPKARKRPGLINKSTVALLN